MKRIVQVEVALLALMVTACGGPALESPSGGSGDDAANADGVSVDGRAADGAGADASACSPGVHWEPGGAAFAEATAAWGLQGVRGARMNAVDYDGDGWTDLLVYGGGVNQWSKGGDRDTWLLRNTGKGTFVDVTEASGLLQRRLAPSADDGIGASVFVAGDVDNDGDIDFFLGRSMAAGATATESSEILLGDGQGHFTLGPADNPLRGIGQAAVPTSASFVDFDRDGFLDLWVVHNMPGAAIAAQD